ncbi:MAG: ribosome silencing factor [Aestuariibaculum sp.]
MVKTHTNADQLISTIISGIEDVKGKEISVLDLREIENTVCDYFIICEGTSNTQVSAIVNSIQRKVSKTLKDNPWHTEGLDNAEWVLIDYVNVVVHVFQKHIREYYDIESLWGDAKTTVIETNY